MAGILVARHLKTTDDLFQPLKFEERVAGRRRVHWGERMMREIDSNFDGK